jgi:ribonuclease E
LVNTIQPSLNAAFISYGGLRDGFLSGQDVVQEAYHRQPPSGHNKIADLLERGKSILVQVTKDAEGQKGAALTTSLSLAGRYLVLTPYDSTRGVSRKVEDDKARTRLKRIAADLNVPQGCGVIIRTNALDQSKAALTRDLNALLRLWRKVQHEARTGKGPRLIYSDQDLLLRAMRDYLDNGIEEVIVDSDEAFAKAKDYMAAIMPRAKTQLIRHKERAPLFSHFDLEGQIDSIYERSVPLPSGGSIVVDPTEALVAIDVNSGRNTRSSSQEGTAFKTNLEAATEVARQLVLRDIGGLVVVDFIDMRSHKSQTELVKVLREAMKTDKARSSVGKVSPNGLVEINRQRIRQALHLRTHRACPTCSGTGRIASPEMVGLNLIRRIEARAATGPIKKVRISLHPELADAFQNSRRSEIVALETEFELKIEVIASNRLHRPDQEIEWIEKEAGQHRSRGSQEQNTGILASQIAQSTSKSSKPVEGKTSDEQSSQPPKAASRPKRRYPRRRPAKKPVTEAAASVPPTDSAPDKPRVSEDATPPKEKSKANGEAAAVTTKAPRRRYWKRKRRKPAPANPESKTESSQETTNHQ